MEQVFAAGNNSNEMNGPPLEQRWERVESNHGDYTGTFNFFVAVRYSYRILEQVDQPFHSQTSTITGLSTKDSFPL